MDVEILDIVQNLPYVLPPDWWSLSHHQSGGLVVRVFAKIQNCIEIVHFQNLVPKIKIKFDIK